MSETVKKATVLVSAGAGMDPIYVDWQEGMTVAGALAEAQVALDEGETATLGRCRVEDPKTTVVQPNDIVVVAGMPGNGSFPTALISVIDSNSFQEKFKPLAICWGLFLCCAVVDRDSY